MFECWCKVREKILINEEFSELFPNISIQKVFLIRLYM